MLWVKCCRILLMAVADRFLDFSILYFRFHLPGYIIALMSFQNCSFVLCHLLQFLLKRNVGFFKESASKNSTSHSFTSFLIFMTRFLFKHTCRHNISSSLMLFFSRPARHRSAGFCKGCFFLLIPPRQNTLLLIALQPWWVFLARLLNTRRRLMLMASWASPSCRHTWATLVFAACPKRIRLAECKKPDRDENLMWCLMPSSVQVDSHGQMALDASPLGAVDTLTVIAAGLGFTWDRARKTIGYRHLVRVRSWAPIAVFLSSASSSLYLDHGSVRGRNTCACHG